jgi:hypothetical protein
MTTIHLLQAKASTPVPATALAVITATATDAAAKAPKTKRPLEEDITPDGKKSRETRAAKRQRLTKDK